MDAYVPRLFWARSRIDWTLHKKRFSVFVMIGFCTLLSACTLMKQPKLPAATGSADNQLLTAVSLIPINANTLLDLEEINLDTLHNRRLVDFGRDWEYRIGPGDVLSIVVWDHPQLTIPAGPQRTPQEAGNWVSPSGDIFYPYIGNISVAGKTISEVREAIRGGLRNVIPNPQVDVSIARFGSQKVHVTGAVKSPGTVPITNLPLTLVEVIEAREGSVVSGDLEHVKLIRNSEVYEINLKAFLDEGDIYNNPVMQSDDVIVVPILENNEVYVLGEVKSPQVVPFDGKKLSLTEALASSEGLSKSTADASGIFVFRTSNDAEQINVYQLNATDPTALLLGTKFLLSRGDVVYVTSAPVARWNRVISNLIPSLGALNTLLLIEDRS